MTAALLRARRSFFEVDQVALPRLLYLDELLPIEGDIQVLINLEPVKIVRTLGWRSGRWR